MATYTTYDRVWETTTTTGLGTYSLSGAKVGYQTFNVVGNGNFCYYVVTNGLDWEILAGIYNSATLTRATLYASSNSNLPVNWGAGSKDIFLSAPADLINQILTLTTKGDILTFNTKNARLPVGADNQVLTASSAQATGLKWSGGSDTQVYNVAGNFTWTKPTNAKYVYVCCVGPGGGGGSGRCGANSSQRTGGQGGGGGGISERTFMASMLGATEFIQVGNGTVGGVAQASSNTNGNGANGGGVSVFGGWITAAPGIGGRGGTNAAYAIGTIATGSTDNGAPSPAQAAGNVPGASAANTTSVGAGAGGNGGGMSAGNNAQNGGNGSQPGLWWSQTLFGAAGLISNPSHDGGDAVVKGGNAGGAGGGGGGFASPIGKGGNGAFPGGGGGGGSASTNGTPSGAGGDGAVGTVIVITYF